MVYKSPYPDIYLPKCNILSFIFPRSKPVSDQPLWIDASDPSNSLSPRQALSWVRKLGCGLDKLGIGKQEVVMILSPNTTFVPVAFWAIVGAGRIFSAANPIYTVNEIEYQLKDTGATCFLVHPEHVKQAVEAAGRVGLAKSRIFQLSDRPCPSIDGIPDWRDGLAATDAEAHAWHWDDMADTAATTLATINYSSGTTGLPKGVCVSHYNIVANIEQQIHFRDLDQPYNLETRPQERWAGFLPIYHAYGQIFACILAPCLRNTVYIMKKFEWEPFLQVIQDYKITHLQAVPPIYILFDKRSESKKYDLSSVIELFTGAAPLSIDVQKRVSKMFNAPMLTGWGMTEVTLGAITFPGGYGYDETGTVGMLMTSTELKLLDDEGREVGLGEPGEAYVKGPQVMLGYWRNEAATRDALKDGWLKTGDVMVAQKRDDGRDWFWLVDRKKELIKVNALQVAPAELEARLIDHEQVADVAVTGITLDGEEWPRAYVVLQDGQKGKVSEQDIQNWFKGQVAKHKWLVGGVKFVDEVPKLGSGKIQRKVMRDWAKRDAKELSAGQSKL